MIKISINTARFLGLRNKKIRDDNKKKIKNLRSYAGGACPRCHYYSIVKTRQYFPLVKQRLITSKCVNPRCGYIDSNSKFYHRG